MKFIVVGLLLNFLLNINAKTVVQIRLIAFRNDGNKAYDGSCCDVFCSTQCDIWFEFCFKKSPSSTCFYGAKTYVLFNDDYSFHSDIKIGKILRNPFQFTYEGIFNGVWFSSTVWDDDHGNHGDYGERDELVDKYTKCQLLITPSLNESSAHPHPFTITGKHSILRLNIEAHCYPNWYGADCNTYCVDTNNQNGHYKCDQKTGNKLCLPKWEGAQCNQAICNETCDLQHATCTNPGDCSCNPGWQNDPKTPKLCNTCIKKTNCLNGYCVNGNDCHCQQDWLGELCNQDNNTCRSFPCQNGATCINNGTDVYYCICPPGYTGFNCNTDIDLCESLPCKHGARCINQRVDYICPCPPGYTDKNCETNIDDCLPTLCLNGATCEDGVDSYNCTCVDGFTGDTCNKNIDDCENIQCQNGGICFDHVANFSCQCSQGFIGRLCETNIDDCAAKPCLNKGNCTDLVNNFKCDCVKGFNGRNCGNNIDECPPGTCGLGNCTDLIGDYNCTCPLGYTGRNCETNINDCVPNICNNGTCQDGINSYVCTCKAGFNGTNCETNIDDCHSNPCRNNGACVDMINSYKCHCLAGWSGKNCEDNIDDCVIRCENDKSLFCTPCKNGASCDDQVNNFTCNCSQGYQGRYCEQKINYCAQNDCQNSATCISQLDGFICKCAPGFKGRNCSENIDECELNKCNGTGTQNCTDKIASFGCVCKDGFKGVLCSEDIDECHPRYIGNSPDGHDVTSFGLCGRNGTCVDGVNSRSCTCDEGFTGKYCQTNIDECDPDPCMNGTCYQNLDSAGYICVCDEGYNGTNCDNDIDECAIENECCENSTCIDGINSYTCQCGPGMKGIDCCSTTSWCENNNTCSRNGQCVDVWNEFRCNCSSTGFTGSRCQQDVDECEVDKICNNGSCDNTRGNYTCWCPAGMTGRHCESGIDDCEKDKVVCKNGFHCIDDHLNFHCNCSSPGFKGKYCDDVDECKQENICGERKTCVNTIGSYKCPCDIGRAGNNCEKVVDDCDNSTCMANHSKNCYLTEQGYDCICLGRWTGPSCTVLNMSLPDPCGCKNGACVFREGRVQYCECFNGTEGSEAMDQNRVDYADHCSGEVSERRSILDNLLSLRIGIGLAAGFVFVLIVIVVVIAWRRHYGKAMLFDDGMDKPTKAMTSRPTLNSVGRLDSRLNPIEKQNRTKNMISNPLHSLSRNNPGMKFELDKIESFEFEEY